VGGELSCPTLLTHVHGRGVSAKGGVVGRKRPEVITREFGFDLRRDRKKIMEKFGKPRREIRKRGKTPQ